MKIPVEERKKYVISLRKRRYTERQIAKELHMSTRDVTKILKENEGEEKEAREREVIEREEKEKKEIIFIKEIRSIEVIQERNKTFRYSNRIRY